MATTFQDFLRRKTGASDWNERNGRRAEWLGALNRLFEHIRRSLREADPDGLLELVPYEVERVEDRLGVYDAPALRIRLESDVVDVVPVGRYATGTLALRTLAAVPGNENRWGDLSGGRVDVTNGDKKHFMLRSIEGDQDRWYAIAQDQNMPMLLDRNALEGILQDLLR